jgi:endonuclease/exonuclease/phosphatase family metal-dependent hydrolase
MSRVRVATYNLYLGADLSLLFGVSDLAGLAEQVAVVRAQLDATRFAERAAAVAALLARERPDLVGLQEVSRWVCTGPDGGEQVLADFLPTLLDALAAVGCAYDAHARSAAFGGSVPVSGTEQVTLAGANVTLVRRGGPVRVLGEATGPFQAGHRVVTGIDGVTFPIRRGWGRVDVRVDGRPLRFVNTHTEAWDGPVRDAQRDEVLAATAGVDVPVVLVGDLNAGPEAVGMPGGWTDAWTRGTGDGFTNGQGADLANETSTLHERIDYVWVRDAEVLSAWVVGDRPEDRTSPHRLWPSDHAGVVADLDL